MKRIVIKIGTRVITNDGGNIDEEILNGLVREMCELLGSGKELLVVSSGAIGAGMGLLNIKKRPSDLAELQSMAAIGQTHLMDTYNKYFKKDGYLTGQILLTQDDFDDRKRYLNIRYTINTLLKHKVVPIINENDTISTEEIKCGDNDRISSLVADLAEADALIILSDIDGLLDKNGQLVKDVERITDEIRAFVEKDCGSLGTGGMLTKIASAEFTTNCGIECYIANGRTKDILLNVTKGKGKFTHFKSRASKVKARKRWIGFGRKVKGVLVVDDGAKAAIIEKNKSLLSAGIIGKKGEFAAGDIVSITGKKGDEIARGITNYSSAELAKIKGAKTQDIEALLGYKDHDEVVHRDNLVIL